MSQNYLDSLDSLSDYVINSDKIEQENVNNNNETDEFDIDDKSVLTNNNVGSNYSGNIANYLTGKSLNAVLQKFSQILRMHVMSMFMLIFLNFQI